MRKLTTIKLLCVAMLALIGVGTANAFNTSVYASSSRLASGKWVKVAIPESGVYEITYDELRRWVSPTRPVSRFTATAATASPR